VIQIREMRWAENVGRVGKTINLYNILIGKPEGNEPHGRYKRGRDNNIKINFIELG
jgi:hypothetical protein